MRDAPFVVLLAAHLASAPARTHARTSRRPVGGSGVLPSSFRLLRQGRAQARRRRRRESGAVHLPSERASQRSSHRGPRPSSAKPRLNKESDPEY